MALLDITRQQEIHRLVENLKMQTGVSYPVDLITLSNNLGVTVFEVDFSSEPEVNAMLVYHDDKNNGKPSIYLSNKLNDNRKRFTLAHELGHYLLHKSDEVKYRVDGFKYSDDSQYSLEETEANYFAALLLVPEKQLLELLDIARNRLDIIADYFGVSKAVIENRIKWLKQNPAL